MGVSDLHVHSSASCDCYASVWDMCESAIDMGLEAIAFTEHVEFSPEDYCYRQFNYHKARRAWQKARERYRRTLKVLFGAEVTYRSNLEGEIRDYLDRHSFDIVMGSVHDAPPIDFWNPQNAGTVKSNPGQARAALKWYFSEVEKLALSGLFDIVGHFGVYERHIPEGWPEVFGDSELEGRLASTLDAIVHNSRLELNAAVLHKPGYWPAPRVEVLRLYKEMGGRTPVYGSDSHHPLGVARNLGLAGKVLKQAGFEAFASWKDVVCKKGPFYGANRESRSRILPR